MNTWVRLNTGWQDESWLEDLSPAARLAWVCLLCYVKETGRSGQARALTAHAAARRWNLSVGDVAAMLEAAQQEALAHIDDHWHVKDRSVFGKVDETAPERMRRYRQRRLRSI